MSSSHFLRMKTLAGGGKLLAAARHNKRAIQKELGATGHIEPARICLNYSLHGQATPDAVAQTAKDMMKAAGLGKLRKNGVAALEIIFSLPPHTTIDTRAYFVDCVAWAGRQFGTDNLLSADVHLDEAAPHLHVLILPLLDKRMQGSEMIGNRQVLKARQASFYEEVSKLHGLQKPICKRLDPQAKAKAGKAVVAQIEKPNHSRFLVQTQCVLLLE